MAGWKAEMRMMMRDGRLRLRGGKEQRGLRGCKCVDVFA